MDVSPIVLTLRSKAYGNSVFSASWKKKKKDCDVMGQGKHPISSNVEYEVLIN